ncbi:hypothetical protein [Clostridium gasigenes]|uniref:20S proteasome, alpha and beta subunits n=1 Tax=Clostridium gasigenes TaxID=94869 RepID=A0A1H0N6K0_9CLOT|nr:hypothetical protein [Clostridium gasigenes]SDO88314.1 hypothetical protein SAMN04488529_101711 [Clostridium gasigenes]
MSLILIAAMEDYIIMMSDGRVSRGNDNEFHILDDNYKKLLRLNETICIGYGGSKEPCVEVVDYLKMYYKNEKDLDKLFNLLNQKAGNVFGNYISKGIKIKMQIVIGGINKGQIKFKTIKSIDYDFNKIYIKSYFTTEEHIPEGDTLSYCMMNPDGIEDLLFYKLLCRNTSFGVDDIKITMKECIDIASEKSRTINKNKFFEVIRR